jgi:hypothetical protein
MPKLLYMLLIYTPKSGSLHPLPTQPLRTSRRLANSNTQITAAVKRYFYLLGQTELFKHCVHKDQYGDVRVVATRADTDRVIRNMQL